MVELVAPCSTWLLMPVPYYRQVYTIGSKLNSSLNLASGAGLDIRFNYAFAMVLVVDRAEGGKLFRVKASLSALVHNRGDFHTARE